MELVSSVLYLYRLLTATTTRISNVMVIGWSKTWVKHKCKNCLDLDWSHVRFWSVMTAPEWTSFAVADVVSNSATVGTRQVLVPTDCLYVWPATTAGTVQLWLCTISLWMTGAAAFEAHVDVMLLQSSREWTLAGWSIHSAADAEVTQRSFEYLTAASKVQWSWFNASLNSLNPESETYEFGVGVTYRRAAFLDLHRVLNLITASATWYDLWMEGWRHHLCCSREWLCWHQIPGTTGAKLVSRFWATMKWGVWLRILLKYESFGYLSSVHSLLL